MTSLVHIGPALGFGGRAHVFEATTIEAKSIALKAVYIFLRFPPVLTMLVIPIVSCEAFL